MQVIPRHKVSPTVTRLLLTPGKETGLLSNLIKSILLLVMAPLLVGYDAMCCLNIARPIGQFCCGFPALALTHPSNYTESK